MNIKKAARCGVNGSLLLALILVLTVLLAACAQEESKETVASSSEYTQTVVKLPEVDQYNYPETVSNIRSLEKTQSDKVWVVEERYKPDGSSTILWELNDDNSWKEVFNINEFVALDEGDKVTFSAIAKNEKVLCFAYDTENVLESMRFYLIDSELEDGYRELKIDASGLIKEGSDGLPYASIAQIVPLQNDRFLMWGINSSLFVLDAASETLQPIPSDIPWDLLSAAELDETIYVLYRDRSNYDGVAQAQHS